MKMSFGVCYDEDFELTRLRSENAELKIEIERLKKLEQYHKKEQLCELFKINDTL